MLSDEKIGSSQDKSMYPGCFLFYTGRNRYLCLSGACFFMIVFSFSFKEIESAVQLFVSSYFIWYHNNENINGNGDEGLSMEKGLFFMGWKRV